MNKPRFSLLDIDFIEQIINVMEYGADLYQENTWKEKDPRKFQDALFRHYAAFCKGEAIDPASGLPHLAHLATNAMILYFFLKK